MKQKSSFDTLDEAYRELVTPLTNYARKHLANKDLAIDAVHDAFAKRAEYELRKPGRKINRFLLYRETIRACRRLNQKQYQLTSPTPLEGEANGKRNFPKFNQEEYGNSSEGQRE